MRRIHDIDLMQLADGELDDAQRAELEAALAADPEAARTAADKAAGIDELGVLVRTELELAADDAEPRLGRMWAEIEKRMELAAEPAPSRAPAARPGLWGRFGRWLDVHRGHILTGALSAGAVAGIALVLRPAPRVLDHERQARVEPPVKAPAVGPHADSPVIPVAARSPVEIEAVEAPGGTSTVFTYATEDGEETAVIWVTPDSTTEGL